MNLSIDNKRIPTNQEWDSIWSLCPYSTFFQSREWAEIWAEYSKSKISPEPIILKLSDSIQVLLPFSRQKIYKSLATISLSSPGGTFGGWLAPVSLDQKQQEMLYEFMESRYPNFVWRSNPYEKVNKIWQTYCVGEGSTLAIDLTVGLNEIVQSWTKGHSSIARKARKANREGIEIIPAENSSDWEQYFQIYLKSQERWGENTTLSYPWNFFNIIMCKKSPNIRLWLAKLQKKPIAGALCFYSPTHVVYWHGAALSEYFSLRPVNLLMKEIISDSCITGYKWFDFNPSGNLEGVAAFKKSFGAQPLVSNTYKKESKFVSILSGISKFRNNF